MLVDMSKTQQSRVNMSSKRQGVVYNGDDQVGQFVDLPHSSIGGHNSSPSQNGEAKITNLLKYDKDDETRKSTGSIHNFVPTQEFIHVRSNSDTSEIIMPPSFGSRINDEKNGERPSSGDSFFALVQRFEDASFQVQLGQKLNYLAAKKGNDRTDWGAANKGVKSPFTSGTASPATDKRVYLNLKRKGSLKSSATRKAKSAEDKGVIIDERNWEKARKAFAHYDVQSATLDFDSIANSRQRNGDCLRRKNTITGASAASGRETAAVIADKSQGNDPGVSPEETKDNEEGDNKSNELVESCPYFRNELGGEQDEIFGAFRYNSSYKALNGHKSSGNKRHSTLDVVLTAYDSIRRGQVFSVTGVTILDSSMGQGGDNTVPTDLCNMEKDKRIFEHVDHGAFYYRQYFLEQDHVNYLGEDERFGAVAVSYKRERTDLKSVFVNEEESPLSQYEYRVIVRTSQMETLRGSVLEECIPSTSRHGTARGLPPKDILEYVCPEINLSCIKLAAPGPKVPEILLKLDEQGVTRQHKIGILYCKAGQSTEEEMYNNEEAGPAFNEFLDIFGERVLLRGFEGYRAQLDNRNDSTGVYSLYRKFCGREVMFHVSTMLPWTPNNRQQLLRKRHIGNDIVTIVFQEPGALQFTPKNIRSHFQHVFILVRVFDPCTANTKYQVAVSRSKDVPAFGPPIPAGGVFTNKEEFDTFLITKLINAENAAHKSDKFRAMAVRTRHEYLKDLVNNYVTNSTVETGAKFGKFSLSSKKKEKIHPHVNPEVLSKGGLAWDVEVEDNRDMSMIKCLLVLSVESFVLIDTSTREAIFYIPCKAIIGWTPMSKKLKLFHGGGDCLVLNLPSPEDIPSIVRRLERVTIGCQTVSMTLRRHHSGQLGFNVHNEGMVVDVEANGLAQSAGLKQNSRLVEIFNKPVATMSYDEMINELRRPSNVPVVVIPPFPNGRPRKGLQLTAINYSLPTGALTSYGQQPRSTQSLDHSPHPSIIEGESVSRYSSNSTLRMFESTPEHESQSNGAPWIRRPNSPDNGDERSHEHELPARLPAPYDYTNNSTINHTPSSSFGSSYTITPKRTTHQPGNETVLSLKYIPRPTPLNPKPGADDGRRSDYDNVEHTPRSHNYSRNPPKIADKRAAADLLQAKLNAHTRTDMHSRSTSNFYRPPPYVGPRPERMAGYGNQDERRMVNHYKPNETPRKPTGQEFMHPRLEIIHSRSKSEPWDPGHSQDATRRTYKETTLGPHITTVETFRENFDNAMSDTVDQIEKAFGGAPAPSDKSPSMQATRKDRRFPPSIRLQDSESYLSSTSNESLPTSEPYSDSERERGTTGKKRPVSSKRLVSKKIGVRAEITSTTAKSPGPTDTHSRDILSPSIQSSTTVFVRSKSNEPQTESTSSLKRSPRTTNTLPRTVNREEVVISRENTGSLTRRKRQGIIRELSQNDSTYVYSPRPFHTPSVPHKVNTEPEAFQFPDADTRAIRDERPKIVSQTKICLMSPPGSTVQLNAGKSPESSPRPSSSGVADKGNKPVKVPYFVKNKREHGGITPELADERISKIKAGKQRAKASPDAGRRTYLGRDAEKEPSYSRRSSEGSQLRTADSQASLNKEGKEESVLNEMTYLLNATDAMSKDASSTLAQTEEMSASLAKVLSGKNDEKREQGKQKKRFLDTPLAARARLPSDGSTISVVLSLNNSTIHALPRRHSLDESILTSNLMNQESKESLTSSRHTLLSSKDGFHRILELENKVTQLSFFLQKEREENIELKRKLAEIDRGRVRK